MNFELEFEFVGYGDCDPVGGGGEGRPRFRNFRRSWCGDHMVSEATHTLSVKWAGEANYIYIYIF